MHGSNKVNKVNNKSNFMTKEIFIRMFGIHVWIKLKRNLHSGFDFFIATQIGVNINRTIIACQNYACQNVFEWLVVVMMWVFLQVSFQVWINWFQKDVHWYNQWEQKYCFSEQSDTNVRGCRYFPRTFNRLHFFPRVPHLQGFTEGCDWSIALLIGTGFD